MILQGKQQCHPDIYGRTRECTSGPSPYLVHPGGRCRGGPPDGDAINNSKCTTGVQNETITFLFSHVIQRVEVADTENKDDSRHTLALIGAMNLEGLVQRIPSSSALRYRRNGRPHRFEGCPARLLSACNLHGRRSMTACPWLALTSDKRPSSLASLAGLDGWMVCRMGGQD